MKIRTLAVLATALALPISAAACSNDGGSGTSGGKPSVDAITKKFTADEIPPEQSKCLAQAMHDGLSAETLNKIMADDKSDTLAEDIGKDLGAAETQKLAGTMSKCLGAGVGTVTSVPKG